MKLVIFEAEARPGRDSAYLEAAERLRPLLASIDGFVAIERFQSLANPGRILSLSAWRDEGSIAQWRTLEAHRRVQDAARESIFSDYRLRVAEVLRDYGMHEREQAPEDLRRT